MHARRMNRFSITYVMAFAFLLMLSNSVHATRFWKNGVTNGNWSNGNNWSAVSAAGADNGGVPTAGEPVRIVNTDGVARTVTLDTNSPALGLVSIDLTGAGAAVNTLSIPNNNTLTVGAMGVGGYNGITTTNGRGAVTQANGTVTVSSGLDLVIGCGAKILAHTAEARRVTTRGVLILANRQVVVPARPLARQARRFPNRLELCCS